MHASSTSIQPAHEPAAPALRSRTRMLLAAIVMLMVTISLMAFSTLTANAGPNADAGVGSPLATVTCARGTDSMKDYSYCLPSGRWGGQIGSIATRVESAGGIGGGLVDMVNTVGSFTHTVIPNMLLQVTQMFWSSALSLSQFAASFAPMNAMGRQIDTIAADMIDNVMSGGLPMTFVALGVLAIVAASAWNIGTTGTAVKRLGVTVLSIAVILGMGTAAHADASRDTPTLGSPWWVVSTINSTMNQLAGTLVDPNTITENNPYMMAYGKTAKPNCQTYLYEMHQQYKDSGVDKANVATATNLASKTNTSAVTEAINTLWEETALRSWVVMQYGSTAASGGVSNAVASNALQSYCHVLESKSGTDTNLQTVLTNRQLTGTSYTPLNELTGAYMFDASKGFIDTKDSRVLQDDSKSSDTSEGTALQRMNVFWQTCGYTQQSADESVGYAYARDGWQQLISNLGDQGTTTIKGSGGALLRYTTEDNDMKYGPKPYVDDDPNTLGQYFLWGEQDGSPAALNKLCKAVINDNALFQSDSKINGRNGKDADAAVLGWAFDVPNVGATWREANLTPTSDNKEGTQETIGYMYGNHTVDTLGALGSVIGSIVNFTVWGMFSIALLASKLMLTFCILTLIIAFFLQAFPIGDKTGKTLINWAKSTCSYAMVGIIYSALGYIAVLITSTILTSCGGASGTFTYMLLAGSAPIFAIILIILTCRQLKLNNPFSVKAVATMAGGGALAAGLTAMGRHAAHEAMHATVGRVMGGFGRGNDKHNGRLSSAANAQPGSGRDSANIAKRAMNEQEALAAEHTTVPAGTPAAPPKPAHQPPAPPNTNAGEPGTSETISQLANHYEQLGANKDAALALAQRKHTLQQLAHNVNPFTGLKDNVKRALHDRPLREGVFDKMKTVAKVGVTAAAFTNPITAPLGLIGAAKMATNRQNWHDLKQVAVQAGRGARTVGQFAHTMVRPLEYSGAYQRRLTERQQIRGERAFRQQFDRSADLIESGMQERVQGTQLQEQRKQALDEARQRARITGRYGNQTEAGDARQYVNQLKGERHHGMQFTGQQQWSEFRASRQQARASQAQAWQKAKAAQQEAYRKDGQATAPSPDKEG